MANRRQAINWTNDGTGYRHICGTRLQWDDDWMLDTNSLPEIFCQLDPSRLSNFKATGKFQTQISCLRDFMGLKRPLFLSQVASTAYFHACAIMLILHVLIKIHHPPCYSWHRDMHSDDSHLRNATWGPNKMADILQTIFSNAFSWVKMLSFLLKFHCGLFVWIQLMIYQCWFR